MTAYGITSSKKVTNCFKGRGKLVYYFKIDAMSHMI